MLKPVDGYWACTIS